MQAYGQERVTYDWWAGNARKVAYPTEFYGPLLAFELGLTPYFVDTVTLPLGAHTARCWLANAHFFPSLSYASRAPMARLRAMEFDFNRVTQALDAAADSTASAPLFKLAALSSRIRQVAINNCVG